MAIQQIVHESGRTMVIGSRIHPSIRPRFPFKRYLIAADLPPYPVATTYWLAAAAYLRRVLLNDQLGDCTIAGIFHIFMSWLANAGLSSSFTDADVERVYELACGYVAGNPNTDQGGNEHDVLNWVLQNGLLADGSHKLGAWLGLDATNQVDAYHAVDLFQNIYLGFSMPAEWVAMMPTLKDGDVFDVGGDPNPNDGHCVVVIDYLANGNFVICTWGYRIELTPAALAKYCVPAALGEAYVLLGADMLKPDGLSPAGFNLSQLTVDLQAL